MLFFSPQLLAEANIVLGKSSMLSPLPNYRLYIDDNYSTQLADG
jgi:hypothetical protein